MSSIPVAFLLLFLFVPISSESSEIDYPIGSTIFNGIYFGVSNALRLAGGAARSVGAIGTKLKQSAIQAAKDGSEAVKDAFLATLVSTTLDFAVDCYVITREVATNIEATFNISFNEDEESLPAMTPKEIMNLQVKGDASIVNEFVAALLALLEKQSDKAPQRDIYYLLEYHIIKLLSDNAIYSAQQFGELLSEFNTGAALEKFKQSMAKIKPVLTFVKELQPKIVRFTQDAQIAITNFHRSLQAQATSAVKSSITLLNNSLHCTINAAVTVGAFSKQTGHDIISIFDNDVGPSNTTLLESIHNDIKNVNFKVTLNELVKLKEGGAPNIIMLGSLQAAVLTLLADKAIVAASTVTPLLNTLGLTSISESLNSATKFIDRIRNHIPIAAIGATKFYNEMSNIIMHKLLLKVGALDIISMDVSYQALMATLRLAYANGILDKDQMDSLLATFGIKNGTVLVQYINNLIVNGAVNAASKFKQALEHQLEIQNNQHINKKIIQLDNAVLDLLTANGIVNQSGLTDLKEISVESEGSSSREVQIDIPVS